MGFQTKTLLLSFAITIVLGFIIVPILKKLKVGQIERDDGPESHLKKQGTPTMGGIIIMLGIGIVTIAAYIYYRTVDVELARNLLPILGLTIGFGAIGFIDDFKKLVLKNTKRIKTKSKDVRLLIISVVYIIYLIKDKFRNRYIYTYFKRICKYTYLCIYTICNISNTCNNKAVNLTDGMMDFLQVYVQ